MEYNRLMFYLFNYTNVRCFTAVVLVLSTCLIWTINYLQSHNLKSYEQPRHIEDRIRVVNMELQRVKNRLEDKSNAKSLMEYSRISQTRSMKVVLAYTALFHEKPWGWMNSTTMFNLWNGISCPYFQCRLSFDNNEFKYADAVLFHSMDLPGRVEMFRIVKQKPKAQKWVYFALESPRFNHDSSWLNNLFHYTLTYRRDSDFYSPYGYAYRVTGGINADSHVNRILRSKEHFIFWAASHCDLPRERFIKKLLSYVNVDIYGKCAMFVNKKLKPSGDCKLNEPKCNNHRSKYKFLLAFENSNCKDYITEKYWGALRLGIVPIVLGGGNYSNPDLAIPGSFINVLDYKTVKELADHLKYLNTNQRAYRRYHEWRFTYREVTYAPWTCQLCTALNINKQQTYISKLSEYWAVSRNCHLTDNKIHRILSNS